MTANDLIIETRELLHDTGRGLGTAGRAYKESSIISNLSAARLEAYTQLVERYRQKRLGSLRGLGVLIENPRLTISRLLKTAVAANGAAGGVDVPSDFCMLECGQLTNGKYVAALPMPEGESWKDMVLHSIFVRGGKFYGAANTAVYWAYPTELIASSGVAFTELPDVFYRAIKYLAAANILQQEIYDNADRHKFFLQEYSRRLGSLR